MPKQPTRRSQNLVRQCVSAGMFIVAIAMLAYAAQGLLKQWQATTGPAEPVTGEVLTTSTTTPQEVPIEEAAVVPTPADMPRSIELPTIEASGFIQKVGIDSTNAVAAPSNIFLAGWYINSVKPGEVGVSLIDGHVQGVYKEGIFKKLSKLQKNDVFYVVYGDGSRRSFTVQSTADYSTEEASTKMLEPVDGIERQLNLITCAGVYNKQTSQYEQRTLVVARANM
jgi:LPXTG-site transpeptidase (sortase) family protein